MLPTCQCWQGQSDNTYCGVTFDDSCSVAVSSVLFCPNPAKHTHMLHLFHAIERQKEWIIIWRKNPSPFQDSYLQTSQAYTSNIFVTYF